jgi:glutamine amidotransferase
MGNPDITLLDCGMGNLQSVRRALDRLGGRVAVTSDPGDVECAAKLVIPGVGHFERAMGNLRELGLVDALNEAVLRRQVPVLGICLGLQLMTRGSEEGNTAGLGWIDAEVVRFRVTNSALYKVPHIGWNSAVPVRPSAILAGVPADAEYYFCHAYHLRVDVPDEVVAETEYDYRFSSVVAKGNILGIQFHPEKSHEAGERLLRNFVEL